MTKLEEEENFVLGLIVGFFLSLSLAADFLNDDFIF
jgi:hypothetical protein